MWKVKKKNPKRGEQLLCFVLSVLCINVDLLKTTAATSDWETDPAAGAPLFSWRFRLQDCGVCVSVKVARRCFCLRSLMHEAAERICLKETKRCWLVIGPFPWCCMKYVNDVEHRNECRASTHAHLFLRPSAPSLSGPDGWKDDCVISVLWQSGDVCFFLIDAEELINYKTVLYII